LFTARTALSGQKAESEIESLCTEFETLDLSVSIHREHDGGDWQVECISSAPFSKDALKNIYPGPWVFGEMAGDIDWLAASYKQFPAFSVGPFFIYGSHHNQENDAIPDGQTGLQIDAATAFGSGEHGTTKGCLLAILDLDEDGVCPWNVLDMGAGSGILGIAAWKIWKTPVLSVDNDEEAVRVACRHRELNHVPSGSTGMICKAGNGFATKSVQEKKPFDLVIANILAVTLKGMAGDLHAVCDKNAHVILSGILTRQVQEVLDVYALYGFNLAKRYDISGWATLVFRAAS
jgi:ribosomal protein L11 methyltransferase